MIHTLISFVKRIDVSLTYILFLVSTFPSGKEKSVLFQILKDVIVFINNSMPTKYFTYVNKFRLICELLRQKRTFVLEVYWDIPLRKFMDVTST